MRQAPAGVPGWKDSTPQSVPRGLCFPSGPAHPLSCLCHGRSPSLHRPNVLLISTRSMSLRLRRSREDVPASSIARHWRTLCLVAAGLILLAGSRAGAGTGIVQSPTLSERVRTSEDPVSLRGEIDTFLDYHFGRLFGEDPSAVAASRAALGDPVGQSSTPAFNRFYAELLADRLLRRFPNAPTFNQLNAAIVTEEVARGTQSTRFGPVITRMAADDDASVAYWAAKAAYPIFPELLQALDGRGREALVTALVGAVQRF